ncbi:MAG TPA: hypothetical protein VIC62_04505 [Nakamurella sp.]
MRKTLLALILTACAALTMPAVANAAPSHAAPAAAHPSVVHPMPGGGGGYGLCFRTPLGGLICFWVVYIWIPCPCPPPPPCDCPDYFDLGLPPSVDGQIYNNILTGLGDLGQATVTTDPQQVAALRAAAMNSFTTAAKMLGGLRLGQPTVGFVDASGKLNPDPVSWRQQAGNDLAIGLTELQQSFNSPNPSALRAAAAANFDATGKILAQHAESGVQGKVHAG